jgi:hypothetical protein
MERTYDIQLHHKGLQILYNSGLIVDPKSGYQRYQLYSVFVLSHDFFRWGLSSSS